VWGQRYVDDLVLRDEGGNRLYALQDAQFNVVAITDNTGSVEQRFAYQAYGQSESLNADFTAYSGTDHAWEYRYTGRELDLNTGLQLNRNRYLHLQLGRWCSRDPIGYEGSPWNLYEFLNGNALNGIDPMGMLVTPIPTYKSCLVAEVVDCFVRNGAARNAATAVCLTLAFTACSLPAPQYKCGKIVKAIRLRTFFICTGAGALACGAGVFAGAVFLCGTPAHNKCKHLL
jgi:RHS repeat-associated protein